MYRSSAPKAVHTNVHCWMPWRKRTLWSADHHGFGPIVVNLSVVPHITTYLRSATMSESYASTFTLYKVMSVMKTHLCPISEDTISCRRSDPSSWCNLWSQNIRLWLQVMCVWVCVGAQPVGGLRFVFDTISKIKFVSVFFWTCVLFFGPGACAVGAGGCFPGG